MAERSVYYTTCIRTFNNNIHAIHTRAHSYTHIYVYTHTDSLHTHITSQLRSDQNRSYHAVVEVRYQYKTA